MFSPYKEADKQKRMWKGQRGVEPFEESWLRRVDRAVLGWLTRSERGWPLRWGDSILSVHEANLKLTFWGFSESEFSGPCSKVDGTTLISEANGTLDQGSTNLYKGPQSPCFWLCRPCGPWHSPALHSVEAALAIVSEWKGLWSRRTFLTKAGGRLPNPGPNCCNWLTSELDCAASCWLHPGPQGESPSPLERTYP